MVSFNMLRNKLDYDIMTIFSLIFLFGQHQFGSVHPPCKVKTYEQRICFMVPFLFIFFSFDSLLGTYFLLKDLHIISKKQTDILTFYD